VPEGDTVWLTARNLHRALAGQTLTRAELRVPRYATARLAGRTVSEVASRGKHLLTRFDDGLTLHTHLGMEGRWRTDVAGARWRGGPSHQLRVLLVTAERQALGFRLPLVELLSTADEERVLGHLGPDLLAADWDETTHGAEAARRLVARPTRPIAEALLDQRVVAGIGNLYKSEVCFLRGLWPWTPVVDVPEPRAVIALGHRLLFANRERWEQATTGDLRRGKQTWAYGRGGRPCLRCGTSIRRAEGRPAGVETSTTDAGSGALEWEVDRVTFWCPRCQPEPGARTRASR
jgi:endonuclease-8